MMTENIERMRLPSTDETAREHREADGRSGRDWYTSSGCACVSCTIERDGELSRALKLLERAGYKVTLSPAPKWRRRTGK